MYFHILALLWPCASVAATEFSVLLTNTTGDVSQAFTLTQLGPVKNTTIPENSTIETYEDVLVNCARPATWDTPSFNAADCSGAIDFLFFETSLTECYSQPCVFYGVNAKTRIPTNGQPTPRKYKFGSCTIGILMLNEYGPGELPGGDIKGASKDKASYMDLEQGAKHIFANCVLKQGLFGWMQAGSDGSIGIFIWASGSPEDLYIGGDSYQDQTSGSPAVLNNSAVAR
ncbi:hypothetical protein JMJ35_009219 [Cladonia borealis]|uniref:Uncharacterized protein n=1 Tax=Cladonia borealis TaxID=184061 RepID=A0AA39QS28_9LECA|nr:hypothetical protein JMJ35_009219 [Cladonia borealis]